LGLSLARELVASLQGMLTWRNHPQGGLEVTVKVPLAPAATPVWEADTFDGTQTSS
jgi:signal transduction histidine kinase